MPRRTDLRKILVVGSGPIVIGQGCEFDYSGTQGAKALRDEGYEVVLVNSNPATIMTDPEVATRTYVEPLEKTTLARIVERERPDALLPTLGGQTALNLAMALFEDGTLARFGVELIGANAESIRKAEDRALFKAAMERIGLACPKSGMAGSVDEARAIARDLGYPLVLRPSFTLGGTGGGIVFSERELAVKVAAAIEASPARTVLVEESVLGWKEFELEVIRDAKDDFIVVCSIENVDPMGVHTGDSVTVAPAMTLTDREYQRLRDAARAVLTEIGVQTGGANVQFAVDPASGRMVVIEMNPRVSRSSALASKATGYPIAKVAARLAVGYTLDELVNDITRTSAAFEPVLDYVVVKWPRFAFEKFPEADPRLGTQMKSVGEAMAIGRTFCEALQKAARSLEVGRDGLVSLIGKTDYVALAKQMGFAQGGGGREGESAPRDSRSLPVQNQFATQPEVVEVDPELVESVQYLVGVPTADRLFHVADAMRLGVSDQELHARTKIDPWFLAQVRRIVEAERAPCEDFAAVRAAKRLGFSDGQLGVVRAWREELGVRPVFARVDTCAAELDASTAYLYSTWGDACEARASDARKVIIVGGGPNRIGQGIEFDYCCVHACYALRELGFETVMINSNPETVSTDYDTADRLYFEPLTPEHVLAVCDVERSRGTLAGVIVQLGGQTPLRLAGALARAKVPILGTSADAIDRAEDRGRFDALLEKLGLRRPRGGTAYSVEDAARVAADVGYPVLVRPSYVLGGRAMKVCRGEDELRSFAAAALGAAESGGGGAPSILVDAMLLRAKELDVDCVCDGTRVLVAGVIEHVEEAGVHSGDSAGVLPPHTISPSVVREVEAQTRRIALELGVVGLMNVQFAVDPDENVHVLEVNPRASRTVPFVAKATGLPLAKIAAKVMAGKTLDELGVPAAIAMSYVAVKESVFPFDKLPGTDTLLGPEMKSTGEIMALASGVERAFGKTLVATGYRVPRAGKALFAVCPEDAEAARELALRLSALGFTIAEGESLDDDVVLVVSTAPVGANGAARAGHSLRRAALVAKLPYFTTIAAARMAVAALEEAARSGDPTFASEVLSLQQRHERAGAR